MLAMSGMRSSLRDLTRLSSELTTSAKIVNESEEAVDTILTPHGPVPPPVGKILEKQENVLSTYTSFLSLFVLLWVPFAAFTENDGLKAIENVPYLGHTENAMSISCMPNAFLFLTLGLGQYMQGNRSLALMSLEEAGVRAEGKGFIDVAREARLGMGGGGVNYRFTILGRIKIAINEYQDPILALQISKELRDVDDDPTAQHMLGMIHLLNGWLDPDAVKRRHSYAMGEAYLDRATHLRRHWQYLYHLALSRALQDKQAAPYAREAWKAYPVLPCGVLLGLALSKEHSIQESLDFLRTVSQCPKSILKRLEVLLGSQEDRLACEKLPDPGGGIPDIPTLFGFKKGWIKNVKIDKPRSLIEAPIQRDVVVIKDNTDKVLGWRPICSFTPIAGLDQETNTGRPRPLPRRHEWGGSFMPFSEQIVSPLQDTLENIKLLCLTGRLQSAVDMLNSTTNFSSDENIEVQYCRALVHAYAGEDDECLEILKTIEKSNPFYYPGLELRCRIQFARRKLTDALVSATRALMIKDTLLHASVVAGCCESVHGSPSEAAKHFLNAHKNRRQPVIPYESVLSIYIY